MLLSRSSKVFSDLRRGKQPAVLAVCLKCHLLPFRAYGLPSHFVRPLAASRSLVPFCTLAMSGVPEKAEQASGVSASRGLLIPDRCSFPDVEPLLLRLTIGQDVQGSALGSPRPWLHGHHCG